MLPDDVKEKIKKINFTEFVEKHLGTGTLTWYQKKLIDSIDKGNRFIIGGERDYGKRMVKQMFDEYVKKYGKT